jgi:LysM repeat protein
MAAIGIVTHSGPGGIGLTQRLLNAGYPLAGDLSLGGFRAENITGGPNKTAAQAVVEWQSDAPHLNTMLSSNLTEIGAGVAEVGNTYYMVIDCALPTTSGQPQVYTPGPDEPEVGTSAPSDFIVPIIASTPDADGLVYHEVQYGQTLWAIAIEYGVKIDEIRTLNNLGPGTDIYQGDRLLVRKDVPPALATDTHLPVPSPTSSGPAPTSTSFPTVTLMGLMPFTQTATVMTESSKSSSVTGIIIGVALVALLLAGMLTWMSSRKPIG